MTLQTAVRRASCDVRIWTVCFATLCLAAGGCQSPLLTSAIRNASATADHLEFDELLDEPLSVPVDLFDRAMTLRDAGQRDAARDTLVMLLQATPDHFPATELLAQLSRELDDDVLYRASLQRLIQLRPGSAAVLNRAGTELLQLTRARPVETDTQDIDAAVTALRRSARLAPHNREFAQSLFGALVSLDRQSEAAAVLSEALRRNPRDPVLALTAARFYEARDDWTTALNFYNTALENDPGNRVWRRQRAVCHFRMGHFEAAAEDFEIAMTGTPVAPQLSEYIMWSEACMKSGDYAAAQPVLDRIVLQGNIRTADIEVLRGLCRLNQEAWSDAGQIVADALVHWPSHPVLRRMAGQIERAAALANAG